MIDKYELTFERLRMEYEKIHCGRYLNVGSGESEEFWRAHRRAAGNRWWKFWKNKSDLEIIYALYKEAKEGKVKLTEPVEVNSHLFREGEPVREWRV